MANIYTVEQVNTYIKNMFQQDFFLKKVCVKGEVSNCKYHSSGHIYFTLKDASSVLACVMFAGKRKGLAFRLCEGQKVNVKGSIEIYERDGKYQLYASEITLDGSGELYLRYESLKRELEEMGMFAQEYKQPLPYYSKKVGIVTAPTGAAVRDIIQISSRRNPYVQLYLYPAQVQGEGAAESVVEGIERLDDFGVDVIIVGRGGGSIEDLWAFNEEIVARAIFECKTPIISAVGHETDVTIADYVADLRAPTPSAAAELAVREFSEISGNLQVMRERFLDAMERQLEGKRQLLAQWELHLKLFHPDNRLKEQRMFLLRQEERLQAAIQHIMERQRHRLQLYIERINGLSPAKKLNQGYAFVEHEQKAVSSIHDVKEKEIVAIHVTDGEIRAEVVETIKRKWM